MSLIIIILLLFLGAFIGFIAGLLGIGGGFIMVPVLIYLYTYLGIPLNISVKTAVGTSLFVIFLTSISGVYRHNMFKNIIWKCSFTLGLCGIIGSIVGVKLVVEYLNGNIYKILFGLFLMLISLNIIYNNIKYRNKKDDSNNVKSKIREKNYYVDNICHTIDYKKVGLIGFLTGFISSVFGVGGGIVIVPFLNIFLKFPIRYAIGTSIGMMMIISLSGLIGYLISSSPFNPTLYNIGYVSILTGLIMAPIAMISSKYGVIIGEKTKSEHLKWILSIILMIIGIKMVLLN
ncbi:sulfite exporter TauE/SafE family protein [Methanothermococcus sp.]|uniref:sulfite exporter TauE/SafE family protein n=1 Tax=Methanothermococcus sp. TaxID=2614238 RepID=UPI0025D4D909|nr:sulfite exporter TauE/SafE family protein [Methanothermococcus sp.]